ncbi:glycosyltransferase family 61 protein [Opitutus terrae]|nr:glycosyltransferase family 61 protein [Opitutus terrae]
MAAGAHTLSRLRNRFNALRLHALTLFWSVIPRDVLRLLPGTSQTFGPPRRTATLAHYRQHAPAEWREVFPARPRSHPPPFHCNDPRTTFLRPFVAMWAAVGVALIPGGRIVDEHGWAVGDGDTLLTEFCPWGRHPRSRVDHIIRLHPPQRLRGRTLNLCSSEATVNFYHYMMDAIARAALVQQAGFTWADFDHVVLPRLRTPTTTAIERAIGVPAAKIIRMGRRQQFACDVLVQPSFPGTIAGAPPWVVEFYRELFPAPEMGRRDRRLYFPRHGRRSLLNAAELEPLLSGQGFESVDPGTTPHLRERLAEAAYVVGVHGAALTNLVFCRPGTRVLELLPSDSAHHHNAFYYYTLCASADMPYGAVVGPSRRHRFNRHFPQSGADFTIAPADFEAGLRALLAEPAVVVPRGIDSRGNSSPMSASGAA